MTTDLVSASVNQDSPELTATASLENLAEPTKSELLMEVAAASKDSPTTMEYALNVLLELSGAPLPTNVSSSVVKTQLTTKVPKNACVLKDLA